MNRLLKRTAALMLTAVMILAAACSNGNSDSAPSASQAASSSAVGTASNNTEKAYYELYDTVADSSDFPDWTGKQLNLKAWYTHGNGDASRIASDQDVVSPEIKRVTGVEIDKDGSFDNGGQDFQTKLGMLNAANDWPDIAFVGELGTVADLIKAGKVYDLTDAIREYAPNLAKRMPIDKFPMVQEKMTNFNMDGKTYGFPVMLGEPERALKILDPNFVNPNPQNGPDSDNWLWVRDDILKKLYPNAKTQDEIDALYMKNGKFTREEIYDVPLKTFDDVVEFMHDVQDLIKAENLQENGKPLEVSYAYGGTDNWALLTSLFGFLNRLPPNNNYFTYYDKEAGQIQFMFQQDFFKESVKKFNQLVRDRVMDPKSLLENNASHLERLNNGQFAVAYKYETPDENVLRAAGKTFRYRKVFLDSPVNTDKFIGPMGPIGYNFNVIVFKDSVKEEDLPQVVRYLDYMISEVGEKMYTWGPRSAGLFEEQDGKRKFKDPQLERAMVYNEDNGSSIKYNLQNTRVASTSNYGGAWPYQPIYMWGGSNVTPSFAYEKERNVGEALSYFDPGNLPGNAKTEFMTVVNVDPAIWVYFGLIPSVDSFWKSRDAFEKALTKTLAAADDAQFEALWKSFSDLAVQSGATPETLKDINDYFMDKNKGLLD